MDEISTKPAKELLKLHKKFHSEIMRWLRKAFDWSGIKTLAKSKARIRRGVYECQYCSKEIGPKQFQIDHFDPCISVDENSEVGYDYNGIVSRMFDMENSFLVCIPCHRAKTGKENSLRKKGVKRKPFSPIHKKRMKKSWTDERKLSQGAKVSKTLTGLKKTEEHAAAMKKGQASGLWVTPNGDFYSITDAAKANSCSVSTIYKRCKKPDTKQRILPLEYKEKYINWKFIPKETKDKK